MTYLVLVGSRGAGKSAAGVAAAHELGVPFVDTDPQIETRAGRTIPEIFATDGEAGFRELEAAVIADLPVPGRGVVATGGGAVVRPENRVRLAALGSVVYLHARPEILAARVAGSDRPRLGPEAPLDEARRLLAERDALYRGLAVEIVESGDVPLEATVAALVAIHRAWVGDR
jgi:shikimate kinase